MDKTPKILFLSKGNASRAQIAEGFLRALAGDQFIALSAGTESSEVSPLAMEVMLEAGIDISTQRSRDVASLFHETFRYAVALCDEPRERHPLFPFTPNLLTWSIPNPDAAIGQANVDLEVQKLLFRQTRDQIRKSVEELVQTLNKPENAFKSAHGKAA